jgi:membrane associated rhomboid family serine protease
MKVSGGTTGQRRVLGNRNSVAQAPAVNTLPRSTRMFLLLPWKLESKPTGRPAANWANPLVIALTVCCFLAGVSVTVSQISPLLNVVLYGFSHAGVWHLVGNMWLLWLFGNLVNRRLGNGLFLAVYLGTIVALGLLAKWSIATPMLGSSGAIYAVIAIAVLLEPRAMLNLLALACFPLTAIIGVFATPRQTYEWIVRWQAIRVPLLAGLVVVPLLLFSELLRFGWNWATAAHLLGVVCGLVAVLLLPTRITLRRSELAAA